jgi:hypothetical protein
VRRHKADTIDTHHTGTGDPRFLANKTARLTSPGRSLGGFSGAVRAHQEKLGKSRSASKSENTASRLLEVRRFHQPLQLKTSISEDSRKRRKLGEHQPAFSMGRRQASSHPRPRRYEHLPGDNCWGGDIAISLLDGRLHTEVCLTMLWNMHPRLCDTTYVCTDD